MIAGTVVCRGNKERTRLKGGSETAGEEWEVLQERYVGERLRRDWTA